LELSYKFHLNGCDKKVSFVLLWFLFCSAIQTLRFIISFSLSFFLSFSLSLFLSFSLSLFLSFSLSLARYFTHSSSVQGTPIWAYPQIFIGAHLLQGQLQPPKDIGWSHHPNTNMFLFYWTLYICLATQLFWHKN